MSGRFAEPAKQALRVRQACRDWNLMLLIAALITLAACTQKTPESVTSSSSVAGGGSADTGCSRPTDVVITEEELKLATAQVGKLSVGGLEVNVKPQVVSLLSKGDRSALVVNYLICEAEQRGELDKTAVERVDYTRSLLTFMQTDPTADQLAAWQGTHKPPPPPPAPMGKLATPDLHDENGKLVLKINSVPPIQTFRILNAGNAPINFWFGEYPTERLYLATRGPIVLKPGEFVDDTAVLVQFNGTLASTIDMKLYTADPDSSREVEVRIPNPQAIAAAYASVSGDFNKLVAETLKTPEATSRLSAVPAEQKPLVANAFIGDVAKKSVQAKWPNLSTDAVAVVAGSLLESANWPSAAVAVYRDARTQNEAAPDALQLPLARALYLAREKADSNKGEKNLAELLALHADEPMLDSAKQLQLAAKNPLIQSQNLKAAEVMLAAIEQQPVLSSFATQLRGDVELAKGNAVSAISAYKACSLGSTSTSCTLRKAEAEITASDTNAAKRTLYIPRNSVKFNDLDRNVFKSAADHVTTIEGKQPNGG
jgi:hypothetical protein